MFIYDTNYIIFPLIMPLEIKKISYKIIYMMFSCSSIGMKLGSGLGAGMVGWLLAAVGYVGTVEVQPIAVLNMIKFIYGVIPVILTVLTTLCLAGMKVVDENRRLSAQN
jgi:GPH family glycoside/pentoside/hexuronide:cation symporter